MKFSKTQNFFKNFKNILHPPRNENPDTPLHTYNVLFSINVFKLKNK